MRRLARFSGAEVIAVGVSASPVWMPTRGRNGPVPGHVRVANSAFTEAAAATRRLGRREYGVAAVAHRLDDRAAVRRDGRAQDGIVFGERRTHRVGVLFP